jgi:hypothetical protein
MGTTPMAAVAEAYCQTHTRILALAESLEQDHLTWQPAAGVHSVAWNLWHLARWADALQEAIPRMTPALGARLGEREQVWSAERLSERWGLTTTPLGFDATGTYMEDAVASGLPLPAKEVLLAYAQRAFAAAEEAVAAVDEQQAAEPDRTNDAFNAAYDGTAVPADVPGAVTVATAVVSHLTHESRHLGEVECLRGQQGLRGSATV